ncbi:MAG: hypothetical protein IJD37_04960 [Clostridia bacterium]|nr:hypothetical protein [Clostridia bacterium]
MKNFAKLLVLALTVALVASLFAVSVFAAPATEPGADPTKLVPGSEKVIFIKDAPRDENYVVTGELAGDGTGTDADNPLKPADHEDFTPDAAHPNYHLQTAFYQATEMLAETGGTIVICGPVYFGELECWGSGASVRDTFTAKFGNNVIKFTSVYNGVDYRETAGAKMIVNAPAMVSILGSSIWENIDIATAATGRAITFDEYCTYVGEGVNCYPTDEAFEGVNTNYISLGSGHRYAASKDENPTLTVMSGTYNFITGGAWGTVATSGDKPIVMENANVNLVLGGTTKVLGQVFGTVQAKMGFSGNVNITINGGTYECDINGVGPTGMNNTDGIVNIKINGGDFKNAWSINQASMGAANNMPAACTVDFSGWTGEKVDLAFAHSVITDITDIKLPAGVDASEFQALIDSYKPAETEPEETTPPATTPAESTPAATTPTATEPDDEETKAPATAAPVVDDGEEGGSNMTVIIIAIVAVVVIAGVVVGIIVSKKKK